MTKEVCSGCGKKSISTDDSYCTFTCRKGHVFNCCSCDCLKAFEKKCAKVSQAFRKCTQKLSNEGQAPLLRRLQPGDREKMKQYNEAEKADLMICPRDCPCSAIGSPLPYCSYVLDKTKQPAVDDEDAPVERKVSEVTCSSESPTHRKISMESMEVVADDMLLELKKEDEDVDLADAAKAGRPKAKTKKTEKNKKGQKLVLDLRSPPESGPPALVPPPRSATSNAWLGQDFGKPAPKPTERTVPVERPPLSDLLNPNEKMQRIQSLTATTGCSEDKATKLLDGTGWNLNAAAEAYFMDESLGDARWAHRAGSAVQLAAGADKVQKVQDAPQKAQEAAPKQQPPQPAPTAPSHPPPPPLPSDWVAVWIDTEEAYYYWHKPTNFTTWDLPDAPETTTSRLSAGVAAGVASSAQTSGEKELVRKISTMIDIDAVDGVEQVIAQPSDEPEVTEERIVNRHWKPRRIMQERCLRFYHGDRVQLFWSSDDEEGWAYGSTVDDKSREGYFPMAILSPLMRKPRQYAAGERCFAVSNFQHPDDVRGYLEMAAGDLLKVLHPLDYPFVWAYVACLENDDINPEAVGWVPEALLEGVDTVAAPGLAQPRYAVKS